MRVRFDRTAPGEGVEVRCRLENGKAWLTWRLHYENDFAGENCILRLCLSDEEGNLILECFQKTEEEEMLESVVLHPQLWQGVENPCYYRLEAALFTVEGKKLDDYSRNQPLYELKTDAGKGILLNGEPFEPKVIRYGLPEHPETAESQERVGKDMERLRELGANSIYVEGEPDRAFLQLCGSKGLLLWGEKNPLPEFRGEMPALRGEEGLLRADGTPTTRYYKYRARWSKVPFVYIVPESIRCQENGNYTVSVYSSCKRVALYSGGVLQSFQSGREEFVFREVCARTPCMMLTAEGEECVHSLSIHKTFTKLSPKHDI